MTNITGNEEREANLVAHSEQPINGHPIETTGSSEAVSEYKPIPIEDARLLGDIYEKSHVVIWAWDSNHNCQHVTTWGNSPSDKLLAAKVGNELKVFAGWPENECQAVPVLFEAAPDLLAALKEALYQSDGIHEDGCAASGASGRVYDGSKSCDCYLARGYAAIAKAEREVQS